jgi:recombination protein RecT
MSDIKSISIYLKNEQVTERIKEVLGSKANQFVTALLRIASENKLLQKATPESLLGAAMTAATLDLSLNSSLGMAHIVPYYDKESETYVAQFQIGWKGFVQLALRSGQFVKLYATDVREGEIKSRNRLTGEIEFVWLPDDKRDNVKIVGYVSYFKLTNGFESTYYMSCEELEKHAKTYSKTYAKGFGVWKENFHAMAIKTVTKMNISKFAPLSPEMQKAIETDQAIISNEKVLYIDNQDEEDEAKKAIAAKLEEEMKAQQIKIEMPNQTNNG